MGLHTPKQRIQERKQHLPYLACGGFPSPSASYQKNLLRSSQKTNLKTMPSNQSHGRVALTSPLRCCAWADCLATELTFAGCSQIASFYFCMFPVNGVRVGLHGDLAPLPHSLVVQSGELLACIICVSIVLEMILFATWMRHDTAAVNSRHF